MIRRWMSVLDKMAEDRVRFLSWCVLLLAAAVTISVAFSAWAYVRALDASNQSYRDARTYTLDTSRVAKAQAKLAVEQAQRQARQFARAVQTSRYDEALLACEHTNARHLNALQYVAALDSMNPAAGVLATNLLNVLAPLRDGKQGRETCEQYAREEVALRLPTP